MISTKVIFRTLRNLLFSKPYFAHLCITHQCNLKCYYCGVWQQKLGHLNLDQWKNILDMLDRMGVAIISITGGEPLLSPDHIQIIEYAKYRGFYVRLTSNGTLSQSHYDRLMDTSIDSVSISLDNMDGNDLPHSKASPKILGTIKHIYNNIRKDQIGFSISMVLHEKNIDSIFKSLSKLKMEFPGLMVFVQPVVTGKGQFRQENPQSVNIPRELANYTNVLNPVYFNTFCEEIHNGKRWACRAGELFFDIKPDGQFYICQDFATPLNVLDEGFMQKWRAYDFSAIRSHCPGCTYACYVLTQEGRKPKALFSSAYSLLKYYYLLGFLANRGK